MQRLKIALIGEIMAPMLVTYRAALVARLDARGAKRLTPSTVARKLAAVRSFFRFCRLTGLNCLIGCWWRWHWAQACDGSAV